MPSPESLFLQVLAEPSIAQRAIKTRTYIPETNPYINNIGELAGRAVGLTVRFGIPLGAETRMSQTPWIPLGNMELAIREASSGGIADHAQVIVRKERQEEMVLLDLGREKIVGSDGGDIEYLDARTIIDHLQADLQARKAA